MSTRPFQAGRLFNADSTFRQGTASNTQSRRAASSTEAADAPRPSSATLSTSASGPRRLLKTTSWPLASASRSEEHTSELQSRLHLVCRLLLEKKKWVYEM